MIIKAKLLAAVLGASLIAGAGVSGCSDDRTERWATTENTSVNIDWDKVNEAYKQANGPEDLERRINEIYEGPEVISISVQDTDDKNQVVTGFFDKDKDGKVSDAEKIFTIKRELKGTEAQYQTHGYGAYYGYSSPMYSLGSGMLMGYMLSSMFQPHYVPLYTSAYTTSYSRVSQLDTHRSSYRAQNPARFSKPSQTGRTYGGAKSTGKFGGGGIAPSRGGSRFGVARRGRAVVRIG
jgi:hypothetical protein